MVPFREIATASPLAMPRNDIKCVARNSIKSVRKLYYFFTNKLLFIPYEVFNVIASEAWQSPGRDTL